MTDSATGIPVRWRPILYIGVAGGIGVWILLTWKGLRSGFTQDDLMNLYGALRVSPRELLGDLLIFFRPSPTYRPAGALLYRLLYEGFGLDPAPLRVTCQVVILINAALAYALARRLSGSWQAGALATALHTYHRGFQWLYVNSGLCYDLLCFFFYSAAFLYYLRSRERGDPPGLRRLAIWSCIYVLCMDSKEMAVSLPVMIGVYELLYHPPASWRAGSLLRWLRAEARVPMWGGILTLLFVVGRLTGPDTLTSMEAYRPVLRLPVYLDRAWHFLWLALGQPGWMKPEAAVVILGLLAAAAVWAGVPALRFGLAWMLIGILPVAFIPQRGMDAVYIPALGLTLYAASAVMAIGRRIHVCAGRIALPACGLAALGMVYAVSGRIDFHSLTAEAREIRMLDERLRKELPSLPRQARVLLLRNPVPEHEWCLTFLVLLRYHNRDPQPFRLEKVLKDRPSSERMDFDVVITYEHGRFLLCDPSRFRGVAVRDLCGRTCREAAPLSASSRR